jgi:predicted RNase H-like HicB family nuclease
MKFPIIIEPTSTGFSAYSPDVPGCGATGATAEETRDNLREAILFHIEGLRELGQPIPEPRVTVDSIEIRLAA